MGRRGPELPETIEEAREILSEREFFLPRSELPPDPEKRRAYVRRLHVLLARTARRCDHSRQVVAGERPPDSEPELPENPAEAEADLDGRSFFVPVEHLPDDADRIGEYVEQLHLQLARAGTALRHNQRVIRQRQASDEGGAAPADDPSDAGDGPARERTDESPAHSTEDGAESDETDGSGVDSGRERREPGADETEPGADETEPGAEDEAGESVMAELPPEGSTEDDDPAESGFIFVEADGSDDGETAVETDANAPDDETTDADAPDDGTTDADAPDGADRARQRERRDPIARVTTTMADCRAGSCWLVGQLRRC